MTIILFLLVLFVLVLVHEWGHFIVAKKTGMRVDEFGIGFPPKAFGVKKGETEYTFNWLPIGGFVRIFGENMEEAENLSESSADSSRAFSARPKWAQALVLIAGVTMNVLFAWFLFVVTLMIGVPTAVEESAAPASAQLYVAGSLEDSPASILPEGAEIIAVTSGGIELETLRSTQLRNFIVEASPEPVDVTYVFGDTEETVSLTPIQGLDEENPDRYMVGLASAMVEIKQTSFLDAIVEGTKMTVDVLVSIVTGVATLIAQSISGTADYSQVAGPVGIVNMVGDAASFGLTALLTFTAIISLNLAVINMLPVPALDGGRLVFVAIEAITGKHIPAVWAARVNLVGFVLLMLLMVAVTYNDIIRLL